MVEHMIRFVQDLWSEVHNTHDPSSWIFNILLNDSWVFNVFLVIEKITLGFENPDVQLHFYWFNSLVLFYPRSYEMQKHLFFFAFKDILQLFSSLATLKLLAQASLCIMPEANLKGKQTRFETSNLLLCWSNTGSHLHTLLPLLGYWASSKAIPALLWCRSQDVKSLSQSCRLLCCQKH